MKKGTGGFELLPWWKGVGKSDDHYEPLLHKLEDNPAIVKSHIMTMPAIDRKINNHCQKHGSITPTSHHC